MLNKNNNFKEFTGSAQNGEICNLESRRLKVLSTTTSSTCRPPTSGKKTPHLLGQFPTLHKSVSTPSIIVDQSGSGSGKNTYVFPRMNS